MRRLRQSGAATIDDRLKVVKAASVEIRGSMVYGTAAVILVFLPVLFLGGVQGRFVAPMALAFILAVVASLVVAVTVTPALSALLLRDYISAMEARWLTFLRLGHHGLMAAVRRAWLVVATLLVVGTVAAATRLPGLESELIPQFREGHFVLRVSTLTPGTSLEEMTALGEQISTALLKLPFIATVEQQVGRAEAGEDTWTPDRSEFHVELTPHHTETEDEAQEQIRGILERIPGISSETLTFLGDRISESISGETAQVAIKITGNDLASMDGAADAIGTTIAKTPGLADLQISKTEGTPTVSIRLDPVKLTSYGVTQQDAVDALQAAFSGVTVGQTYEGVRSVDVVVILPPDARHRLDSLQHLMVGNATTRVRLNDLTTTGVRDGRATVQHESGERVVTVSFNAAGRSLQDLVRDVRRRVEKVELPKDVFVAFTGQAEAEREGHIRLAVLSLIATALIVLVLTVAFARSALAILVLVNIPFCLLGSVAAIEYAGVGLTLGSLVGLVTVFGIGARNSIMLLAHSEHLVDCEQYASTRNTFERAAGERLIPILMTALMAALGLVPLALGIGHAGHEIEAPMAITVLGGLATATLLNLAVLPELISRLGPRLGLV